MIRMQIVIPTNQNLKHGRGVGQARLLIGSRAMEHFLGMIDSPQQRKSRFNHQVIIPNAHWTYPN